MDQVIELMAYYLADWQQTAINNTRYSAVLAALAFLTGGLMMAILKRGKIVKLMRQVMNGKQQLEKSEKTHEELLSKQKIDEEQIAGVQQQLEDASTDLQLEKEAHQENILKKDELFTKAVVEKQQEVDAINTMLDEKNLLADRLQNDLNEQNTKIAQFEEAQSKIVEMQNQISKSTTELNTVKQQLESELTNKNEQVESSYQSYVDRASDEEYQLKQTKSVSDAEKIQHPVISQPTEKAEIPQEKPTLEVKVEPVVKIEATVQQQVAETVKPVEPTLEQRAALAAKAKQPSVDKKGIVSKVMGWFTSIDKALEDDVVIENTPEKVAIVEKVEIKSKPIIKQAPAPKKVAAAVYEESDSSSTLAELADKMDSIQSGFKRFFKRS